MRKILRSILIWVICLASPVFVFAQTVEKAPTLALKDLSGKIVRLEDFKGKVVLLNFWATWCAPCRAEIPELVKWQTEYQNQGLQIIGITYPPTNRAETRNFVRQNKINYPILLGSKKTKLLFDSTETMPYSVVIDQNGNIAARIEGIIYADEFDEKIKPLLEAMQKKTDIKERKPLSSINLRRGNLKKHRRLSCRRNLTA